jgi:hypothetical protein
MMQAPPAPGSGSTLLFTQGKITTSLSYKLSPSGSVVKNIWKPYWSLACWQKERHKIGVLIDAGSDEGYTEPA